MLKLFVWPEFIPDYTDGLAFVVASNEKEAKKTLFNKLRKEKENLCLEDIEEDTKDWGPVEVYDIEKGLAFYVLGGA